MVTTANVTDRTGAMDIVDYYYNATDHLSVLKKVMAAPAVLVPAILKLVINITASATAPAASARVQTAPGPKQNFRRNGADQRESR